MHKIAGSTPPLGGESEQKTKGRRKRRALVGLGDVDVARSLANQVREEDDGVRGKKQE